MWGACLMDMYSHCHGVLGCYMHICSGTFDAQFSSNKHSTPAWCCCFSEQSGATVLAAIDVCLGKLSLGLGWRKPWKSTLCIPYLAYFNFNIILLAQLGISDSKITLATNRPRLHTTGVFVNKILLAEIQCWCFLSILWASGLDTREESTCCILEKSSL